jgi:hypothetical protein
MPIDPQALYVQLGRLIEEMPDLKASGLLPERAVPWLARAEALPSASGDLVDQMDLRMALQQRGQYPEWAAQQVALVLHRALAKAELSAPIAQRGAFIPAGSPFDAIRSFSKILGELKRDVLIIDPYLDEKALTDFAPLAPEAVSLRLLADERDYKPALRPAAERWTKQYGSTRPLEVRLAASRSLHDRLIIADGHEVWTLTQSLNAFASRSPASIVRVMDDATVRRKIDAYHDMWATAAVL